MTVNETPNLDAKQQELLEKKVTNMENNIDFVTKSLPIEEVDVKEITEVITNKPPIETPDLIKESSTNTLKDKIAELENYLGGATKEATQSEITFKDSMGNETYYVRNICGMHVVLSDLEIDKIPVGKSVDLLQYASLEDLKKSRDLRKCIRGVGAERTLKRLTEQEYYEDIKKEVDNKKKLAVMQQQEQLKVQSSQQNPALMPHERTVFAQQSDQKIRGVIESKLGKLMLRSDPNPEHAQLAMQSVEFITWVHNERLTHAEIEYIMGHPAVVKDHDIRAALLEKKAHTPPE